MCSSLFLTLISFTAIAMAGANNLEGKCETGFYPDGMGGCQPCSSCKILNFPLGCELCDGSTVIAPTTTRRISTETTRVPLHHYTGAVTSTKPGVLPIIQPTVPATHHKSMSIGSIVGISLVLIILAPGILMVVVVYRRRTASQQGDGADKDETGDNSNPQVSAPLTGNEPGEENVPDNMETRIPLICQPTTSNEDISIDMESPRSCASV